MCFSNDPRVRVRSGSTLMIHYRVATFIHTAQKENRSTWVRSTKAERQLKVTGCFIISPGFALNTQCWDDGLHESETQMPEIIINSGFHSIRERTNIWRPRVKRILKKEASFPAAAGDNNDFLVLPYDLIPAVSFKIKLSEPDSSWLFSSSSSLQQQKRSRVKHAHPQEKKKEEVDGWAFGAKTKWEERKEKKKGKSSLLLRLWRPEHLFDKVQKNKEPVCAQKCFGKQHGQLKTMKKQTKNVRNSFIGVLNTHTQRT